MKLFIFGLGYSAAFFARRQIGRGHELRGTVRSREKADVLTAAGIDARIFNGDEQDSRIKTDIADCEGLLISVPPGDGGDPVLRTYKEQIVTAKNLRWIGYLSTIGVYGDHSGKWVDENTPANPTNERSRRRAKVESGWLSLTTKTNAAIHVFRLAGIYGPGQNQLVQIARGTARRLIKPDQVFNRIHVEDIARVLEASIGKPRHGAIYNVTDNEPAPPQDAVSFAAQLCGVPPPLEVKIEDAALTEMGRSFYEENKRVRNRLIQDELGVTLAYPTYREGLSALKAAGDGNADAGKVDRLG
ncbi:MAG: SDR family oxidoreductase [Rhizobiales bacterium]|nr:SDR family oxidoreductase [Hyphomicrobiales bacterium]